MFRLETHNQRVLKGQRRGPAKMLFCSSLAMFTLFTDLPALQRLLDTGESHPQTIQIRLASRASTDMLRSLP